MALLQAICKVKVAYLDLHASLLHFDADSVTAEIPMDDEIIMQLTESFCDFLDDYTRLLLRKRRLSGILSEFSERLLGVFGD